MAEHVETPDIVGQTKEWLVCSKPARWLTIPGRGHSAPVLRQWAEEQSMQRIFVVHRIDFETSGLVLFAKSEEAHRKAGIWFEKRQVRKRYDFLSQGEPSSSIFKTTDPIEGKPSTTQFEVRENWGSVFLGQAIPLTGRRHQIRIHLSKKGNPILGDETYGGPREVQGAKGPLVFERVALHARKLELPSGESFEAPWPHDFRGWVDCLRALG